MALDYLDHLGVNESNAIDTVKFLRMMNDQDILKPDVFSDVTLTYFENLRGKPETSASKLGPELTNTGNVLSTRDFLDISLHNYQQALEDLKQNKSHTNTSLGISLVERQRLMLHHLSGFGVTAKNITNVRTFMDTLLSIDHLDDEGFFDVALTYLENFSSHLNTYA